MYLGKKSFLEALSGRERVGLNIPSSFYLRSMSFATACRKVKVKGKTADAGKTSTSGNVTSSEMGQILLPGKS